MNEIIKTKFGNARINKHGYYVITSRKEGNRDKKLHRLIWEDYYGKPIPDGYVIHHVDGNKLNNEIDNLQCLEANLHTSLHKKGENHPFFGKHHSEETRKKMSKSWTNERRKKISEARKGKKFSKEHKRRLSEAHNTTGYYRVSKHTDKKCKQGFIWHYEYHDENGERKTIERVNLDDLEKEVKKRGLEWYKIRRD